MANQDDMKVGVLADLADIEQQGQRAGEAFKKGFGSGFGPGGISGALLGNGMAPTQGVQQGPGDGIAGILEKILQSLDIGFGRLLEAAGGGLGGGASSGGGGTFFKGGYDYGDDKKQAQPTPSPSEDSRGRGMDWGGILGAASRFPQQSYANAYSGGFYQTDVASFAAQATSSIPLVGQFLGVVSNTMQQRDEALRNSLGIFRGGGTESWRSFHDLMTNRTGGIDTAKHFGIDRSEAANLQMLTARAGMSRVDASQSGAFGLQGIYGLGAQGINTQGSFMKGGGDGPAFAQVLALAIGTQLDRGRWGEAFDAISKAAGRITTGNVDTQGTMGMMNFIGNMGARFQGDSQASGQMVGMLQGMQGGSGGAYGNLAALQAAGLGQSGVSFTDAWMRVQRGAAAGGVGLRDVLKQYERLPAVQTYLSSGSERDLNTAVFVLSRLLPAYKPTDIEALLRSMQTSGYKSGEVFKIKDGVTRTIGKVLTSGKLPGKEGELIASQVEKSMEWSEAAIGGSSKSQFQDWETPAGLPENMNDLEMSGAMRTQPPVTTSDTATGAGGEYITPGSLSPSKTSADFMSKHVTKGGRYGASRPDTAFHPGVDVMPTRPGDPIYSLCNGTIESVISNPQDAHQGAPGFGLIVREDDKEGGRLFRYFHIDPASVDKKLMRTGARIRRGQKIGNFFKAGSKAFRKGMPIHSHVTVQRGDATGGGVGTMAPEGQVNLEELLNPAAAGADAPGTSSGGGGASPSAGPTSMNGPSAPSVDVNVYVYDGRISVQKAASSMKRAGDPNRMYGTKIG